MENNVPLEQDQVDILALVVVSDEQAGKLGQRLVENGFRYTIISAVTALLPAGSACLMIGTHSSRIDDLNSHVDDVCRTRQTFVRTTGQPMFGAAGLPPMMLEAQVGSASVYILPVETYLAF